MRRELQQACDHLETALEALEAGNILSAYDRVTLAYMALSKRVDQAPYKAIEEFGR